MPGQQVARWGRSTFRRQPAVSFLVLATMASCKLCPTTAKGGDAGPPADGGTDAGPSGGGVLSQGDYSSIYSGVANPTTTHLLAGIDIFDNTGKDVTINQNTDVATGLLNAIQFSAAGVQVEPVESTAIAGLDTVVMAPAAPDRGLYLEIPSNASSMGQALGNLTLADLSVWPPKVTPLPGSPSGQSALNVPIGAYWFGQNGAEMLYIDDFDGSSFTGDLEWSNGDGTTIIHEAVSQGQSLPVAVAGLVLSADRSTAVVGFGVNYDTGVGGLMSINMATGAATTIASPPANGEAGVAVLAQGYSYLNACTAPTTSCTVNQTCTTAGQQCIDQECRPTDCLLSSSQDPAFSISGNGQVVAYDQGGTVNVWIQGNSGSPISLGKGRFPGVSLDGEKVAYFDMTAGTLVIDDLTAVLQGTSSSPTAVTTVNAVGYLAPQFTPDDRYVAVLEAIVSKGASSSYGGDMGTVQLVAVKPPMAYCGGMGTPVMTYAKNVLWHSLAFWPLNPTVQTTEVLLVGNMRDPFNGTPTASGIGDVLVDNPDTLYTSAIGLCTCLEGECPSNAGGICDTSASNYNSIACQECLEAAEDTSPPGYCLSDVKGSTASSPAFTGISPGDLAYLTGSGGAIALVPPEPLANALEATLWLPGAPGAALPVRPGTTAMLAPSALTGTLVGSGSVPALVSAGANEVVFKVADSSYSGTFDGRLSTGDLWAVSDNSFSDVPSAMLVQDSVFGGLTSDGRVMALQASPMGGSSGQTALLVLPIVENK